MRIQGVKKPRGVRVGRVNHENEGASAVALACDSRYRSLVDAPRLGKHRMRADVARARLARARLPGPPREERWEEVYEVDE